MPERRPWIVERAAFGTDRIAGTAWPTVEPDGTLIFRVRMPSPANLRMPLMVAAYAPGSWTSFREADAEGES